MDGITVIFKRPVSNTRRLSSKSQLRNPIVAPLAKLVLTLMINADH